MPISRCNAAGLRILLGLALVLVTLAMIDPEPPELPAFSLADKIAHAATFLVLAFLADAGWPEHPFGYHKVLLLVGYGVFTEVLQHFVPTRMFSTGDVLADTAGVLLYGLLGAPLLRRQASS